MNASNIREVRISDEAKAPASKTRGVTLTISELHKDYRAFVSDAGMQEITEVFALYLTDYQNVSITIDADRIEPAKAIASRHSVNLIDIADGDETYPARLEVIEWRAMTNRTLYLCNNKGFPLIQVDRRFHIGSFQFSAYLKSDYIAKLQSEGTLELAEMNPSVATTSTRLSKRSRSTFEIALPRKHAPSSRNGSMTISIRTKVSLLRTSKKSSARSLISLPST